MENSVNSALCDSFISLQFLFVHEQENSFSGAIPSGQFCSQLSPPAAAQSQPEDCLKATALNNDADLRTLITWVEVHP
jgi:hypothetical protein